MKTTNEKRIATLEERRYKELFGFDKETFEAMLDVLVKANAEERKRGGKKATKITILDRLVITLGYWREYRAYRNIAFDYGVSKAEIGKIILWTENTLIKCGLFNLPSKRDLKENLSDREVMVVDVTEQPYRVKMPKISIIVPVYNVSEYLRRCLDSCVYQTFEDIEVVVVNDFSPDERDDKIISEYINDYPDKIKYIKHEQNKGLGEARNTAIRSADGEFLMFCDSDDFLELSACEKLYARSQEDNADLVVFDFWYMRDGILGYRQVNNGIEKVDNYYRPCMLDKGTVWVIMLKKSIIIDNDLFSSFRFFEDCITPLWYLSAVRISKINEALYYYVYRKTSLIGTMTHDSANQMANVYIQLLRYPFFLSLNEAAKTAFLHSIFCRFFGYWMNILIKNQESDFCELFKNLIKIKNIVENYEDKIICFKNITWESQRSIDVLRFAEGNIQSVNFNLMFRAFYASLDKKIVKEALSRLKQELIGRKIVLWSAGSMGQIMRGCLENVGFEFETTDLTAKAQGLRPWGELKQETDVVLLTSGEFEKNIKKMVENIKVINLHSYLNENV